MRRSALGLGPRTCPALATVVLLAAVSPLPARAPRATLTVRLTKRGSGPRAKTVGTMQIVDGSTGEILVDTRVGANGQVTLRPGAIVGFAVASVVRPRATREGVSDVFRFDPATRKMVVVPLHVVAPAIPSPAVIGLHAPDDRGVATMGSVTLTEGGRAVLLGDALLTPLFNGTTDFLRWVDTSPQFLAARRRELALQDAGKTDPSTRIVDTPLAPDVRIEGELASDGGRVTGEIRLVDPDSGETLARVPVDAPAGDWSALLEALAGEIARALRQLATTTTTSTTTSTSSSSTTATGTTGVPTTTLTSSSSSTTTSLPPGTCTSILPASFCACTGGIQSPCTSDAFCQTYGEGTCVDRVGHTLVTYELAGSGGRLGAIGVNGTEVGLYDVVMGGQHGLGALGNCGTAALTQGLIVPLDPGMTTCAAYYHPGAALTLTAKKAIVGPQPYCPSLFTGWSGAVACTGMGTCDASTCTCTATTGMQNAQIVATYEAQESGGCVPASAP